MVEGAATEPGVICCDTSQLSTLEHQNHVLPDACGMHACKNKNLAMQNIARFLYFNGAGDMNRTRDLLILNEAP